MGAHEHKPHACKGRVTLEADGDAVAISVTSCEGMTSRVRLSVRSASMLGSDLRRYATGVALGSNSPAPFGAPNVQKLDGMTVIMAGDVPALALTAQAAQSLADALLRHLQSEAPTKPELAS